MPGLNRTGPTGAGAMTGGRRGLCNSVNTDYGRGWGQGRQFRGGCGAGHGYGFGRGRAFTHPPVHPPVNPPGYDPNPGQSLKDEVNILKTQANLMQNTLNEINQQIASLAGKSEETNNPGATDD